MRTVLAILFAAIVLPAHAQQPKEIKVPRGKAAAVINLVSVRPDCSLGTVGIPTVREAPKHGGMSMAVTTVDVAAQGNCPARKVPAITLVYVPTADFVGADVVTVDIADANKVTSLSYRLVVSAPGEQL